MSAFSLAADDIAALSGVIRERARSVSRPLIVAIDGRSGAGKSTLAGRLAALLDACVLEGDDFFAGGVAVRRDSPEQRVRDCIDWRRQRPVLEALRAGREARYFAFDWEAFDGRLKSEAKRLSPHALVVFEGVYSARPELCDLTDLKLLLAVDDETRSARLVQREGAIDAWERQWHEAEELYFRELAPVAAFDVVLAAPAQRR